MYHVVGVWREKNLFRYALRYTQEKYMKILKLAVTVADYLVYIIFSIFKQAIVLFLK